MPTSSEMTQLRRRNPQATRAALIHAAERLFRDRGVDGTPVSAIVREAGVAQGTFYLYFDSKDDCLDALAEHWSDEFVAAYAAIADREDLDAVEKLLAGRRSGVRPGATGRSDGKAMRHFHREEHHEVHDRIAAQTTQRLAPLVARVIRQGVQQGSFDTPYPDEAAWLMLSMSQALDERRFERGAEDSRLDEAYADAVAKLLGSRVDFAELYRLNGVQPGPALDR